MLVSHRYRFIFIKTTKTAGTSIEVDLARLLAEDDIVTPIFPPEPGHRPRNHDRRGLLGLGRRTYYNHMPAELVRRYLGRKLFDSYFKFCVEREPVDKCISHYSMLRNSRDHGDREVTSWDSYVRRGRFPIDAAKYTDREGRLLVDRILRYESLNQDLGAVARELGIPLERVATTAKAGWREDVAVSAEQRQIIYERFRSSNRFSGYRLDPEPSDRDVNP